jgi:hypothetical protein
VYYSIIGDERFADVYHDARVLGSWLQLLLVADAMYPADAPIPAYVHRASFAVLVKAGLVENAPHQHYRVHGLASERGVRSHSARNAAAMRWQSESNASASASGMPRTEENRTAQNRTEQESDLPPLTVAIDYLEDRTKRNWHGRPGQQLWDTLMDDLNEVGIDRLLAAYRSVQGTDFGQIIFAGSKALHPIVNGQAEELDPAYVKEQLAIQRAARKAAQ